VMMRKKLTKSMADRMIVADFCADSPVCPDDGSGKAISLIL